MYLEHVESILKSDPLVNKFFRGVLTADRLDSFEFDLSRTWVFVTNTLCDGDPNVGHWVAVANSNFDIYFFDPSGTYLDESNGISLSHLTPEISNFLQKMSMKGSKINFVANGPLQSPGSISCGEYSIVFVREICHNKSVKDILDLLYGKALDERENFVRNYVANSLLHKIELLSCFLLNNETFKVQSNPRGGMNKKSKWSSQSPVIMIPRQREAAFAKNQLHTQSHTRSSIAQSAIRIL
ncbi:hypothetical protein JTE90_023376 [Oedothorax gibbosus]|uniref:Ubiquitin-like protease family profile domain-containing protein n=1 Tax=Oedothorax gibbosus TaxID=931172 RepID=A0AAV6V003_9ARAC|nr:hypothetical protein JTE90_023376 [Oedothorax gibbosus]